MNVVGQILTKNTLVVPGAGFNPLEVPPIGNFLRLGAFKGLGTRIGFGIGPGRILGKLGKSFVLQLVRERFCNGFMRKGRV
jgi:hypothetical protein